MLISIQQKEYEMQISAMSSAGVSVKGMGEKPETTGNMISLEELLESYSKLSDLLKGYGKLLQKDARQMRRAASSLISFEQNLLK